MAIYRVPMVGVAATVQQDLWHIKAGAVYPIVLREIHLEQTSLSALELWQLVIKRHTSTVTQGSGGSTPTPVNVDPGGSASGVTAHMNDTTKASAGTLTNMVGLAMNVLNGCFWLPPPEHVIKAVPGTGLVVTLNTTPSASATLSGCLVFEELGL